MELYEVIERRRTIRKFIKPAPEKTVCKIIMAGTRAISAVNQQPWEFILVDDPELIEQISSHKYQVNLAYGHEAVAMQQKKAYENCNVVAACYKNNPGALWSIWCSIQNMALAATAEGLGIIPSTLWGEPQAAVQKLLGLPDGYELATMVLIGVQAGYPFEKTPQIKRRPDYSWLHRNRFSTLAANGTWE